MIIVVVSIVILSAILYVLGIKISVKLKEEYLDIFEEYGSPSFVFVSTNEYKLILDFMIFGGYKRHLLDKDLLKIITLYKYVLLCLISAFIAFMILLGNSSG